MSSEVKMCPTCNKQHISGLHRCWDCYNKDCDGTQIYACSCGVHISFLRRHNSCNHQLAVPKMSTEEYHKLEFGDALEWEYQQHINKALDEWNEAEFKLWTSKLLELKKEGVC